MARDKDGKIQKAFDYNPQSPHQHKKHDVVYSDHPTRLSARDAGVEYLRLIEAYRNDIVALKQTLSDGMFATNINENIPNPAPKCETTETGIQSVKDYMDSKLERGEHDH